MDIASSAELTERQPENYQTWNVQINEEYHGDTSISALAGLSSAEAFTGDNIWWFYCAERRPRGTPFVGTEPDNDSEPECVDEDCLKTYINNAGTSGWVVYDEGAWSLPDGFSEGDLEIFDVPFTNAAMANDAMSCSEWASAHSSGASAGAYMGLS